MSKSELRLILDNEVLETLRAIAQREMRSVPLQLTYMITNWDRVNASVQINPVNEPQALTAATHATTTPPSKRGKYHPRLHKGPGAPKAKDRERLEQRQAILDNLPSDAAREAKLDEWDADRARNDYVNSIFYMQDGEFMHPPHILAPWLEFADDNGAQNWAVDPTRPSIYVSTPDRDMPGARYYYLRWDFNEARGVFEPKRMDEFYTQFFSNAMMQRGSGIQDFELWGKAAWAAKDWKVPEMDWHAYVTSVVNEPAVKSNQVTNAKLLTRQGRHFGNVPGYKPVV